MTRVISILSFLVICSNSWGGSTLAVSGPCDLILSVPTDQHICDANDFDFCGIINTTYPDVEFDWLLNGSPRNLDLCDEVDLSETTTFTLMVTATNDVNLIQNGDFANGDDGSFTTDYFPGQGNCNHGAGFLGCEGAYNVLDDPSLGHNNFAACDDLSGDGNMMVINGAENFQEIWCQEVCVDPEASYNFSAWAASVNPGSPARLQFSIDGNLIGTRFDLSSNTCLWENFESEWQANGETSVRICVTNQNTTDGGNDFAIDELEFIQICHAEETFEVTVSDLDIDIDRPDELTCEFNVTEINLDIFTQFDIDDIIWDTSDGNIVDELNRGQRIIVDAAGLYSVTVIDEFGCELEDDVIVESEIEEPILEIMALDTLDCQTNSIDLLVTTNVRDEEFEWSDENGNFQGDDNMISVITGGTYTVTVTDDDNGCTNTAEIQIAGDFSLPPLDLRLSNRLDCNNSNAIISTSNPHDSIVWVSSQTGPLSSTDDSLVVAAPGTYIAQLVLGTCSSADTISVQEIIPDFQYDLDNDIDILTCSDSIAQVSLNVDPNLFRINWTGIASGFGDNNNVSITSPGTYTFNLLDSLGCVTTDSVIISENTSVPLLVENATSIECNNPLATVSLEITNNVPIDSVRWILPDGTLVTDDTVINVAEPGTVFFTVSNSETGCTTSRSIDVISNQSLPDLTLTADTLSCNNPLATLVASSNHNIVRYTWTLPDGNQQNGDTISSNQAGIHQVIAIDDLGCEASMTIVLAEDSDAPALDQIDNIILTCLRSDTMLLVNAEPNVDIEWITPSGPITDAELIITEVGNYTLVATNVTGCQSRVGFEVTEDTAPPMVEIITDSLDCERPLITPLITEISGSPVSQIVWSLPDGSLIDSSNFMISQPGSYQAAVTGENGCQSNFGFAVGEIIVDVDFELMATPINCNMTESTITLESNSQDISTIEFFAENDLVGTGNQIIIEEGQLITAVITDRCNVEQTSTISPAVDTSQANLVVVANPLGCQVSGINLEISANVPIQDIQVFDSNDELIGNELVLVTQPGRYTVEAKGENGCIATTEVMVVEDNAVVDFSTSPITLDCNTTGSTIEITTNDIFDFVILSDSNGNFVAEADFGDDLVVTEAGDYVVIVFNINGCPSEQPLFVDIDDAEVDFDLTASLIDCNNIRSTVDILTNEVFNSILVLDQDGNEITTASFTDSVLLDDPGDYTFIVENINGCTSMDVITIDIDTSTIEFSLEGGTLTCNQSSVIIDINTTQSFSSGLYTTPSFEEFPINGDIIAEMPGTYTVALTTENGCISRRSIDINQNEDIPDLINFSTEILDCEGNGQINDFTISGGMSPYELRLNGQVVSQNNIISVAGIGSHELLITDANGCQLDTSFVLEPLGPISISTIPEISIMLGEEAQLSVESESALEDLSFEWSPATDLSCSNCPNPIFAGLASSLYTVTATNSLGCLAVAEVNIIVEKEVTIYIPNVINLSEGNPDNNRFTVFTGENDINQVQELRIYDRWGNQVFINENFQPNNLSDGWDGRFNNQEVNPGVFAYMTVIEYLDGTTVIFTGDVTVIR